MHDPLLVVFQMLRIGTVGSRPNPQMSRHVIIKIGVYLGFLKV